MPKKSRALARASLIALLCLHGCASVTIKPIAHFETTRTSQTPATKDNKTAPRRAPDFEQSVPFAWFGLAGTHYFNVHEICEGRDAIKIKTLHTFSDLVKGLRTAFFRLPKTAKIWCELNGNTLTHKE